MKLHLPSLLSALLLSAAWPSLAQQMNYQGRLTNGTGAVQPDGQYTIEFSLWNIATGGTTAANQVWGPYTLDGSAGRPQADLVNGRFNVVLGPNDTNATPRSLTSAFGDTPRYLQISMNGVPISPRQQLLAAPTALHANFATQAETAANFTSVVLKTDEVKALVGIGTSSPATKLHVLADGDTELSLESKDNRRRWTLQASGGPDGILNGGTLQIVDRTAVASRFIIRPNGNVGIGTTTPAALFDVFGTSKALQFVGGGTALTGLTLANSDLVTGNRDLQFGDAGGATFFL